MPISFTEHGPTQTCDFAWADLDPSTPESDRDKQFRQAGELLGHICRFIAEGNSLQQAGLRAVAIAAFVRPDVFSDTNGSQSGIAQRYGLSSRAWLQKYIRRFRVLAPDFQGVNTRNKHYRHESTIKAIAQHRAAGHKMKQ